MKPTYLTHFTVFLVLIASKPDSINCAVPEWECDEYAENGDCLAYHNMDGYLVSENVSVGVTLYTLQAFDPAGNTSGILYNIDITDPNDLTPGSRDGNDYFNVNSVTGEVTLKQRADYEEFTQIRPTWRITAGTEDTTTLVTVPLTDANDNRPEFVGIPYVVESLPEDAGDGEIVFSDVSATDNDETPELSLVTYYIVGDLPGYICETSKFTIDESRGFVILISALSYNEQSEYTVCLEARDQGTPYQASNTTLRISVIDVQGDPPIFLDTPYVEFLSEDLTVGTEVIRVNAIDGDRRAVPQNDIEFEMVSGDDNNDFTLTSLGVLTLNKTLDRERRTNYTLEVQAREFYNTQPTEQMSLETITLIILDVNDNRPVFVPPTKTIELMENSPDSTYLDLGMTVTDADEDLNANFKLSLSEEADGIFALKEHTVLGSGKVDIIVCDETMLDCESSPNIITFQVMATELGFSEPESSALVTVKLQDVNDNPPIFDADGYECVFNGTAGTVCQVRALDADATEVNQDLYYAIVESNNDGMFEIDPKRGNISLNGTVSKDGQTKFNLEVIAKNTAPPYFDANTTMTIQVTSEPKPAPVNLALVLGASVPAGVLVLVVLIILLVCVVKKPAKSRVDDEPTKRTTSQAWSEDSKSVTQGGQATKNQTGGDVEEDRISASLSNTSDVTRQVPDHFFQVDNENEINTTEGKSTTESAGVEDVVQPPGVLRDSQADIKSNNESKLVSSRTERPKSSDESHVDDSERKDLDKEPTEDKDGDTPHKHLPSVLPPINDHTDNKNYEVSYDPSLIESPDAFPEVEPTDTNVDDGKNSENKGENYLNSEPTTDKHEDTTREHLYTSLLPSEGFQRSDDTDVKNDDKTKEDTVNTPDANRVASKSKKKKHRSKKKSKKVNEPVHVKSMSWSEEPTAEIVKKNAGDTMKHLDIEDTSSNIADSGDPVYETSIADQTIPFDSDNGEFNEFEKPSEHRVDVIDRLPKIEDIDNDDFF